MSTKTSKQIVLTGGPGFVAGPSNPIMLDLRRFHGGASIICTISPGGAASYWVEVSGDPQEPVNVGGPGPAQSALLNWNTHDILGGGTYPPTPVTTSANSNLAFPATFVRLNCQSLTGTLTMSLVPAIGIS